MSDFLSPEWIAEAHTILTALPAAGKANVTVQYAVNASPHGKVSLHTVIADGAITAVVAGRAVKPDITVTVSYDDALGLINGTETSDAIFMRGDLKVEGAHAVWLFDLRDLRAAAREALSTAA